MGHHIDSEGRFQSDRDRDLKPDRIVLSFNDPHAWSALAVYASYCREDDLELADDIEERLRSIQKKQPWWRRFVAAAERNPR